MEYSPNLNLIRIILIRSKNHYLFRSFLICGVDLCCVIIRRFSRGVRLRSALSRGPRVCRSQRLFFRNREAWTTTMARLPLVTTAHRFTYETAYSRRTPHRHGLLLRNNDQQETSHLLSSVAALPLFVSLLVELRPPPLLE